MFEQDMRALRPYVKKVFVGLVLKDFNNCVEGDDYENPERLIDLIEKWIEMRKNNGWQNAYEYSLEDFMRREKP